MKIRMRMQLCPLCGYSLDAVSPAEPGSNRRPKPDDVTVCIECESLLVFDHDLRLRAIQLEDLPAGLERELAAKTIEDVKLANVIYQATHRTK